MRLKNFRPKKWLSFTNDGRIRHRRGSSRDDEYYKVIEGYLVDVELVEDTYEDEVNMKYRFIFEDEQNGELGILETSEGASAARGILTSLMSLDGPVEWVLLSPYRKKTEDGNEYTNVYFEHNEEKVDWLEEILDNIPPVKMVPVGDKEYKDDSKRRQYYRSILNRLKKEKLPGVTPYEEFENESNPRQKQKPKPKPKPASTSDGSGRPTPPPPHQPGEDTSLANKAPISPTIREIRRKFLNLKEEDPTGVYMDIELRNNAIEQITNHMKGAESLTEDAIDSMKDSVEKALKDLYENDDDLPF